MELKAAHTHRKDKRENCVEKCQPEEDPSGDSIKTFLHLAIKEIAEA